ncbi:bifunctional ornithine acetyltransferase/N-acetylglutamate synthase, partial [Escherichia coli]|uniref:bifunctional ornithine acetyltransferase/N-acetylglutamate synthase n=1 Tax=Escherichia coli TaxID=562 RepID=UPI00390C9BF5
EKIARTVGHSQLVKTAVYGKDPNWGRIVAAAGRAGVPFNPDKLSLTLCGIEIFKDGQPVDMDIDAVFRPLFDQKDIDIQIHLAEGN